MQPFESLPAHMYIAGRVDTSMSTYTSMSVCSASDTARIAIFVGGTHTPAWARWQILPLRHMLVVLLITAVESGFTCAAAVADQESTRANARISRCDFVIGSGGYRGLVAY